MKSELEKENEALKLNIEGLAKENTALISTTQGLQAIVNTHILTIASQNEIIDRLQSRLLDLEQAVGRPETNERPSLLERIINRII